MRYKPLPREAEIDPEAALLQAVFAFDAAGTMAEKLNDVEGMLNVGAMWMKLGETIHGLAEAEQKAEAKQEGTIVKSVDTKISVGFGPVEAEADPITVEEDEDGGFEES